MVPELLRLPPLILAFFRSSVELAPTVTVPLLVTSVMGLVTALMTVSPFSTSVPPSMACSVPVLITDSPAMSSSPPFASIVPELISVAIAAGSMVRTPPVASSKPKFVMSTLVMALVPVESSVPLMLSVPPVIVAVSSVSAAVPSTVTLPPVLAIAVPRSSSSAPPARTSRMWFDVTFSLCSALPVPLTLI